MTKTPSIDALGNVIREAIEIALFNVMMRRGRGANISDQEESILASRAALAALLSATEDEECGECGGTGTNEVPHTSSVDTDYAALWESCENPDCNDGSVPGEPLIIRALIEAEIDVVGALVKLGVLPAPRWIDTPEAAALFASPWPPIQTEGA